MRKFLSAFAVLAMASAPAVAQTTAPAQTAPEAQAKPKTVTKVVCERVTVEQETGSRLRAAPKKCKKVEVPAEDTHEAHKSQPQGHSANAH